LPVPLNPVQVAIVEDHPEFREALCQALSAVSDFQLLPVCKDLPAGLQLLAQQCPDVLLVDLGLPSGSGLGLIREAQRRWGTACTSAVLTVMGNEEHLFTAVAAGAKGYLFKSDQPADWQQAVQQLAQGQSPLQAKLAHAFLQREPAVPYDDATRALLEHVQAGYTSAEAAARLALSAVQAGLMVRSVFDQFLQRGPDLSPRELELLQLLNKGLLFKQCAELMGVSENTTKTQAARAYQKLGASNLQAALYEARAAHLLA